MADGDGNGARQRSERLREDAGEKASRLRWGRLGRIGMGDLGGQPQVRQDALDRAGVIDRCDQAQASATPRAGEDIDVEGRHFILHLLPAIRRDRRTSDSPAIGSVGALQPSATNWGKPAPLAWWAAS